MIDRDFGDTDRTAIVETSTAETLTATINGGPRVPAQLVIITRVTWMPTPYPLADPHWEHIDSAGHWHGFTEHVTADALLPTLESLGRFKRCAGCADVVCRGWHQPDFRCQLCHETVTPVFRFDGPDTAAVAIPTIGDWHAELAYAGPARGRVQARFFTHAGDILIGDADVTEDGRRLDGAGALATRGNAGLRPLAYHQAGPA